MRESELIPLQIGSSRIIARERLVNVIAYSLFTTSNKLRALVADLLGNLSKFSHFAVLAALSEFRVVHNENYRFEYLIECLAVREEEDGEADGFTEPVIWEWRTAGLSMINGLVIGLEELSERTLIREEFGRRGLNEVITVSIIHK